MSSKAGYLKSEKNLGNRLQKMGETGYNLFDTGFVRTGAKTIGQVLGSIAIPIPVVGGQIGKAIAENTVNRLKYGYGLMGEVGGMINGEKSIGDVLTYIPKTMINEFKNSHITQVLTGKMNWRDGVVGALEDFALLDFLAPGKTHAWKDQQGNYHRQYVDGAKMVVGEWKEVPNTEPRPDLQSNRGILGVGKNGEILYKGFDQK